MQYLVSFALFGGDCLASDDVNGGVDGAVLIDKKVNVASAS
jgi:hypothetical protein